MGIGAYRHLVTLEHPVVVLDPPTWYCSMQPAAQVSDGLAAFFIRGRFHPGIGLETQITFEGRTFQVQAVQDLDERHREIQVTAVEVVGRGTTPGGAPVFVPPTITVPPEGATIDAGESVMLTVIAVGAVPLFYQWTKDGADLPGAIYQFLDTGPITATTTYAVRVSNAYGAVISAPATIEVTATYQSTVIADGASAYWPLDDPSGTTARDLMGTYDGTISGGVTLALPGVTAETTCMSFDGVTGKIDLPPIPSIQAGHTFEAWSFRTTAPDGTAYMIGRNVDAPGGFNFGHREAFATNHRGTCGYPGIVNFWSDPVYVANDAWHYYVVTHDGTTARFYIDGVATGPGSVVAFTDSSVLSVPLAIGRLSAMGGGRACLLQDVAIYPRALTPAEIAAHYALRVP
jgi:hypothetical protein